MITNTAASVNGTAAATTTPTRQPMLTKHTTSTTTSAAKNLSMNSSTEALMLSDWSVTLVSPMPSGISALMAPTSLSSAWPRSRPFQPSRMITPSSKAGSAPLRMMKVDGSS